MAVGQRKLLLTQHALQRMVQRRINQEQVQAALATGELFAYVHSKIPKIGYYDPVGKVFVAVDQRHTKVLTLISGVPDHYVRRLQDKR